MHLGIDVHMHMSIDIHTCMSMFPSRRKDTAVAADRGGERRGYGERRPRPDPGGSRGRHQRPVRLHGVNMYLEHYRDAYPSAMQDVRNLRTLIPAANTIRFVA